LRMSWSDDEWDADAAVAEKEKAKAKAEEADESSEEEDNKKKAADSADEEDAAPAKPAAKPAAAADENIKIVAKDSLQDIDLHLQKDVDTLVKMLVPKLKAATAKKAISKFIADSLTGLQVKLTLPETEAVHKLVKETLKKRQLAQKKREAEEEIREAKEKEEKKAAKQEEEGIANDDDFFKDFM